MSYVMRIVGFANEFPCPWAGQYLKAFTPHEEIKGEFTDDIDQAMRFAKQADAWQIWMTSIGTRPDGKPDRPLTAFTVEVLPAE